MSVEARSKSLPLERLLLGYAAETTKQIYIFSRSNVRVLRVERLDFDRLISGHVLVQQRSGTAHIHVK